MQLAGIPPSPAGGRRDPSLTLRFVTRSEARRLDEAHLDEERGEAVALHQLANTAVVAAVAPQQPPDSAVVSAVAPQLSDEELSRRYVSLGILAAQRGANAPLRVVGAPERPEGLSGRERRLRAWGRVTRVADVRLRRVLRELHASVDLLQFEVGAVPVCLNATETHMELLIGRLDNFRDACVEEADICARYLTALEADVRQLAAELAANARPSDDSEPEPTPNAAGSSRGP